MPWVQRDRAKKVLGLYARQQVGIADEFLSDDNPEVLAFRAILDAPPPLPNEEILRALLIERVSLLRPNGPQRERQFKSDLGLPIRQSQLSWMVHSSSTVIDQCAESQFQEHFSPFSLSRC